MNPVIYETSRLRKTAEQCPISLYGFSSINILFKVLRYSVPV